MGSLIAGVDTSTQATKVLIVDAETGRVIAQGRAGHTVTGERGAREDRKSTRLNSSHRT